MVILLVFSASSSELNGGVGVEGRCVRKGEQAWLASPLCSVLSAAMSEQEVPPSVVKRIIIKFLTNEGVKPSEILTHLKVQFGDTTLSENRVFTWARQFSEINVRHF